MSWQGKPPFSWCAPFSVFGLLQLFTHWHHFWSDVLPSKKSKLCSQSLFLQKQTWACFTTSRKASLALSQRKDTFQVSHLCSSFLWWYPATISVILSLWVHSISYSPFQFWWKNSFQCKMETQGLWSPVVVCSGACLEQSSSPHPTQLLPLTVQNFPEDLSLHFCLLRATLIP